MPTSSTSRIAKNTLFLYFRMGILLLISLYTTRLVLKALGNEEFGTYNLIGGIVTLVAFLNRGLSSATQRYLSFEIGRNDIIRISMVFNYLKKCHLFISFIILLIAETIGLWVVNYYLNIPKDLYFAANILFQCSILSTICAVMSVPYNALLISMENMKVFAGISIAEAVIKLLICLSLVYYDNKLIIYGLQLSVLSILIRLLYFIYCRKKYYNIVFKCENSLGINEQREIVHYSVWALFGGIVTLLCSELRNVIINRFFGVIVNAAMGIATQVNNGIVQFIHGYQTAMNPQIVKSVAISEYDKMHNLIFVGCKFSFFILYTIAIPLIYNIHSILNLWLGVYPDYTIIFCILTLINSLIVSLSGVLSMSAMASGTIRNYQMYMSGFLFLNIPLAIILFKLDYQPYYVFYVSIVIEIFLLFSRLFFLKKMIYMSITAYLKKVLFVVLLCVFITNIIIYPLSSLFENNIADMIISSCFYMGINLSIIFFIGLNKNEKAFVHNYISKYINKIRKRCNH